MMLKEVNAMFNELSEDHQQIIIIITEALKLMEKLDNESLEYMCSLMEHVIDKYKLVDADHEEIENILTDLQKNSLTSISDGMNFARM